MQVNSASETEPALEIYLSSDKSKRDCALVTDFPKQLLEALQIRHSDATSELHQYLEVPLESLNILLVRKGIIGEVPSSSAASETAESDETSEDEPTHHEDQLQSRQAVAPLASPERRSSVTLLAAPATEFSRPSAAATRQAVPSSQSPSNPDFVSRVSAIESPFRNPFAPSSSPTPPEGPEELPPAELVTSAGIYNTSNRSRNTDRLRQFARHSSSGPDTSRNGTSNTASTPNASVFNMTELGSALGDAQASVSLSALVYAQSARRPQARLVLYRNQRERARDFEIGFLGEHYVSGPVARTIPRSGLTNLASRCLQFYVTGSGCPISVA